MLVWLAQPWPPCCMLHCCTTSSAMTTCGSHCLLCSTSICSRSMMKCQLLPCSLNDALWKSATGCQQTALTWILIRRSCSWLVRSTTNHYWAAGACLCRLIPTLSQHQTMFVCSAWPSRLTSAWTNMFPAIVRHVSTGTIAGNMFVQAEVRWEGHTEHKWPNQHC